MSGEGLGLRTVLVGQSGGATPVINASLAGVVREAQARGARRILGMAFGVRGLLESQFVELTDATPDFLAMLAATPSSALGACRYKLTLERLDDAVAQFRRESVDACLYIGGNDSAETTRLIAEASAAAALPTRCLAIPKTIDNDLPAMDHTPGYGSAARLVATLARDLGLDAWAMQREEQVRILEVYGRDSGWLAAASVLGRERPDDPPHLVLVPELPFDEDAFLAAVERQVARAGFCTVVVGEMLRDAAGRLVGADTQGRLDAFGHAEARRPGAELRALVQRRLGMRAKDDRPGSIQKVTADLASAVDREEAYELGRAAVAAAWDGETGKIMTLERVADEPYCCRTGLAPLAAVAGQVRQLPSVFLDAAGQPNAAFRRYALPMLGAPLSPRVRFVLPSAAPVAV